MKNLEKNIKSLNFKRIKSLIKIILPVLSGLIFLFNTFYYSACKSFYGIELNCFNNSVYQNRWLFIASLFILAFAYYLSRKYLKPKSKSFGWAVYELALICVLIFSFNLVMFIVVMNYPSIQFLTNFAINYSVAFFIGAGVFSLFVTASLLLCKSKKKIIKILSIIFIIMEIMFCVYFIFSFGSPNPQNITSYTVATINESEKGSGKYIIVGEYKDNFVCMKIEQAFDENGEEMIIKDNTNNEIFLNYSEIYVKKSEYQLFSASDIGKCNTYKYITLNPI